KGDDVVVVAIPRGGLPVAEKVAKSLKAPLDIALVKKLGHPVNKEYAIGAVGLNNVVLSNMLDIPKDYIERETIRVREILKKRYHQYYGDYSPKNLEAKTVIIIDDGIATGNTVMATVELTKAEHPAKIVVAIPVAPKTAVLMLRNSPIVDEVACLFIPQNFQAVGQFYRYFSQVSDEEVISILKNFREDMPDTR
ncbi:MAG: phosphoribosyltransferase family protein, partial [Flavobacteriaceae bacterium]